MVMPMDYDLKLYGPIPVDFDNLGDSKTKFITPDCKKRFLAELERLGIAAKEGCYIFALRNGKGCTPWYVGKATKNNIGPESMEPHKLNKYSHVFARGGKGTPVMFFVCQPGTVKTLNSDIIDDMETELIQYAKYKNPELLNEKKAKLVEWGIQGVLRGSKRPSADETLFARAMGIG